MSSDARGKYRGPGTVLDQKVIEIGFSMQFCGSYRTFFTKKLFLYFFCENWRNRRNAVISECSCGF